MNSWTFVGRKGLVPWWKSSAMAVVTSKSATGLCADCAMQDGQTRKSNNGQAYVNERKTGFYVRETEQPMGVIMKTMVGKLFGRWTVTSRAKSKRYGNTYRSMWQCLCECGTVKTVFGNQLRAGMSKSCGCLQRDTPPNYRHGRQRYPSFIAAKNAYCRCNNPQHGGFKHYGGRGILFKFTDAVAMSEWIDENLGPRPVRYSIDRVNNNGHYEPGNLGWASKSEQRKNQRSRDLIAGNASIFIATAIAILIMIGIAVTVFWPIFKI